MNPLAAQFNRPVSQMRFKSTEAKTTSADDNGFFPDQTFPPSLLKPRSKVSRATRSFLSFFFSSLKMDPKEQKFSKTLDKLLAHATRRELKVQTEKPGCTYHEIPETKLTLQENGYTYSRKHRRESYWSSFFADTRYNQYYTYELKRQDPAISFKYDTKEKKLIYLDQGTGTRIETTNGSLKRKGLRLFKQIEKLIYGQVKMARRQEKERALLESLKKELQEKQAPDLRY